MNVLIEQIAVDHAVLVIEQQRITVPTSLLPPGATVGQRVVLSIQSEEDVTLDQEARAKALLNEILKGSS